jgi:HYR domain-containing protein
MNAPAENFKPFGYCSKQVRTKKPHGLALIAAVALAFFLIRGGPMSLALASLTTTGKQAQVQGASLGKEIRVQAAGRGKPWINLGDGRDVLSTYSYASEQNQLLESDQVNPLTLASGDFDGDGVPDLISGYSHAGSGVLTIHRGNVDSIYPNTAEARKRKSNAAFTDSPFLSPARVFELTAPPDFMQAGDFNADGHFDVITASPESNTIWCLPGNGHGGLGTAQAIELPGRVTALVSGDVNRADGLIDLVVAIHAPSGPKVMVFEGTEGAIQSNPELFDLPDEARAIAIGYLDDDYSADLAVAAGREVLIVQGRDRKLSLDEEARAEVPQARTSHHSLPSAPSSLALGDFTGDQRLELAVMSEDGALTLMRERADTRIHKSSKRESEWEIEILATDLVSVGANMICARVSSLSHENLVIAEPGSHQLRVWMDDAERRARGDLAISAVTGQPAAPVTLRVDGDPIAVLSMRLNEDALSDLVILRSGQTNPSILQTLFTQTFCVTTTSDCEDCGSLRDAITNANDNPGADLVNFGSSFNGVQTITLQSPLPAITEALNVDGTAQCSNPNFADSVTPQAVSMVALDGSNSVSTALNVSSGGTRVIGFVVNRFISGLQLTESGGNLIEGNFIGLASNGNNTFGNQIGLRIRSRGNTIGGTVNAASNFIAGNGSGVVLDGTSATDNQMLNNVVGTNAAVTQPRGNIQHGVTISNGAIRNTIGGSFVGAANEIAASGLDGVFVTSANGNNILRNQFELNDRNGISIVSSAGTRVGGTNDIVRNNILTSGNNGVEVSGSLSTDNLVQGNFIGILFDSIGKAIDLGNGQNGVSITSGGSGNFVGGLASGAGNLISLNRADGVLIAAGNRNAILSNRIFSNGGLGIHLLPGANDDQAAPVLTTALFSATGSNSITANSVTPHAAGLTISVSLNSTPNSTFTLQFFFGSGCECKAPQCIGAIPIPLQPDRQVTTDNNGAFSGSFTFSFTPPFSGGFVNATATKPNNSTSQFSQCVLVTSASLSCAPICPASPAPVLASSPAGATVSYPNATLPTGCPGVTVSCSPPSNSTFPIGVTTVTCTASDSSGNRGSCSFTVSVTAPAGPSISSVFRDGKHLRILGERFAGGAKILFDGATFSKTIFESTTSLKGKKLYKKLASGQHTIQVRNSDGTTSPGVNFTK